MKIKFTVTCLFKNFSKSHLEAVVLPDLLFLPYFSLLKLAYTNLS